MAGSAGGTAGGRVLSAAARTEACAVWGRLAVLNDALGCLKSKAEVRSPQTVRRQGEMFGSCTPKRCSSSRITEVWSNTWLLTQPPRLQGEITYIGTRGPRP